MRVDVQWATDPAADYVFYGHVDWNSTPNRGDPTKGQPPVINATEGLIAHVSIMGVRMPQADFYAIESHPNDIPGEDWTLGVLATCWSEAGHGDTVRNRGTIWEIGQPFVLDERIVVPQRVTMYFDPTDPVYTGWRPGFRIATPWTAVVGDKARTEPQLFSAFPSLPPNPARRYGITLTESLYADHLAFRPIGLTENLRLLGA